MTESLVPGLISVIIPTLDFNEHLRAAVCSILLDGYEHVEIIIVVDGPLPDVFPDWADDPKILTLSTGRRLGAAGAINHGLTRARGDFIARLDADDISIPGRFVAQLERFEENPDLVMVGTTAQLIDERGEILGDFYVRPYVDLRKQLLTTNPFVHSSLMVRHAVIREVGGYDIQCIRMQDYDLILRIARVGEVAILSRPYVQYRVHSGQSSKQLSGFFRLMRRISFQRRRLARMLNEPIYLQVVHDVLFASAQLLRYAGLRKPRYLIGSSATGKSSG